MSVPRWRGPRAGRSDPRLANGRFGCGARDSRRPAARATAIRAAFHEDRVLDPSQEGFDLVGGQARLRRDAVDAERPSGNENRDQSLLLRQGPPLAVAPAEHITGGYPYPLPTSWPFSERRTP